MKNKKVKIFSTLALTIALVLNFSLVASAAVTCGTYNTKSACENFIDCKWTASSPTEGTCSAATAGLQGAIDSTTSTAGDAGLATDTSVPAMVGNTIKIILGISGTAALVIVVIGGVKWMTSGGAEAKITSAIKLMVSGAIGIVIIAAAYAITSFVMNQMLAVVG
ncbi:hypothetical protein K9L04_01495 [Patescibacteria group bacterium]|nr:hypothetical protein [Patescibacteria group bacterium]